MGGGGVGLWGGGHPPPSRDAELLEPNHFRGGGVRGGGVSAPPPPPGDAELLSKTLGRVSPLPLVIHYLTDALPLPPLPPGRTAPAMTNAGPGTSAG